MPVGWLLVCTLVAIFVIRLALLKEDFNNNDEQPTCGTDALPIRFNMACLEQQHASSPSKIFTVTTSSTQLYASDVSNCVNILKHLTVNELFCFLLIYKLFAAFSHLTQLHTCLGVYWRKFPFSSPATTNLVLWPRCTDVLFKR